MKPLTLDSPVIDPRGFTATQLAGLACVLCHMRAPRVRVGTFPYNTAAHACDDHDIPASECSPAELGVSDQ